MEDKCLEFACVDVCMFAYTEARGLHQMSFSIVLGVLFSEAGSLAGPGLCRFGNLTRQLPLGSLASPT